MRKIFFYVSILFSVISYSQNNGGGSSTPQPSYLPNLVPPSPEAFAITKYGDIPIGEYTGMLNLSLPIYTYKSGQLELPIVLRYNASGLKVNDYPTKVGMSWVLDAGGVITRTIKDQPDENSIGGNYRILKTSEQYNNLNTADGSLGASTLVSYIDNPSFDTEVDIFNYNFLGYSGSFYLDQNYNPILAKEESELKISVVGDLRFEKKFVITTPDGVKYFFGGVTAVESSFKNSVDGDLPIGDTSYYLTKVQHPINGEILIEYETKVGDLISIGKNESITFMTYDNFPTNCVQSVAPSPYVNSSGQFIKIANSRYISKIHGSNSNQNIYFIYLNINGRRILDKIEIKTIENQTENLINQVKLNYIGLEDFNTNTSSKRFFLANVIFNNEVQGNDNKKIIWSYEYDDPFGMPNRLSYEVDTYGYYNGQIYNSTLLPKILIPHQYGGVANNNIYPGANKDGSFQHAKKGALIKINYPTKGYTMVEYEPNPFKKDFYTTYANLVNSADGIYNASIPGYNNLNEENVTIAPIFQNQTATISYSINSNDFYANHSRQIRIKITNLTESLIIYDNTVNIGMQASNNNFDIDLLKNKQYKFEIFIVNPNSIAPGTYISATLSFKLFTDVVTTMGDGIRVKKVVDYDKANSISNYKRYYYVATNYIDLPIYQQPIKYPNITKYFRYSMVWKVPPASCAGGASGYFSAHLAKYTTLTSNAISEYFDNNGFSNIVNPVVVTSLGGENFENGGIQKIYHVDQNYNANSLIMQQNFNFLNDFNTAIASNDFTSSIGNNSIISGDLVKEYYFKKTDTNYFKVKQINYNYQKTKFVAFTNLVGKRVFDIVYYPEENPFQPGTSTSNYFFKQYASLTFRNILKNTESFEYFSNISMPNISFNSGIELDDTIVEVSEFDTINDKKIITSQEFSYGTLRGLTLETKTYSSDGSMLLTKNYYPNQANSISFLSTDELTANNKLVSQNRIATPIQVEQYRNGDLLSTQRTVNKSWNNNPELILPEKILTSKGTQPLEERAIFSEYDANGNLSVLSLKDGSKTKYFYNNLNQVILKVENYTSALNIPAIPTWTNACTFIAQYPSALISVYNYDTTTNQIVSIINPNCKKTEYFYDELHRLKYIKDNEGNIVQEYDQNYKPQN